MLYGSQSRLMSRIRLPSEVALINRVASIRPCLRVLSTMLNTRQCSAAVSGRRHVRGRQQCRYRRTVVVKQQQEPSDNDDGKELQRGRGQRESSDATDGGIGGLKKGQGTAIVTGAISLLLGVAYLLLASALNNRGLVPPPEEAFNP